jgi:hypothetical protein
VPRVKRKRQTLQGGRASINEETFFGPDGVAAIRTKGPDFGLDEIETRLRETGFFCRSCRNHLPDCYELRWLFRTVSGW